MDFFFLELELSGTYLSANPGLKIFADGQEVAFGQVSSQTGSGTSFLSFTIPSSISLSSLSFRFEDNAGESNRDISIHSVKINNYTIHTENYIFNDGGQLNGDIAVIQNDENLDINVNALDFVFGQADPELSDFGTATLTGTAAGEKLVGGKTSAIIDAGAGDDEIRAGQEDDIVFGGDGRDHIYGNDGDDVIIGGAGNDHVYARNDNDFIIGGAGNDALNGGDGNDVISGGTGQDKLYGENGNDILDGGADNDRIYGQAGDDKISGGDGNDAIYTGTGTDFVDGGAGADKIWAEGGENTIFGGAGNDVIKADNDSSLDTLDGGEGNDVLLGGNNGDVIYGGDGNDRLEGRLGDDTLDGGDGNDKIFGQEGNDTIYGGDGTLDFIYGGDGDDIVFGQEGVDKILGENGNDTLHGGDGNDNIRGQDGDDLINGDAGDDRLFGDDGNDTINGGTGNDWIRGLAGADILNGGDGNDTFIHDDNIDVIDGGADYDIIQLGGLNGNDINITQGDLNAINIEHIAINNFGDSMLANLLTMSIADIASISGSDTLYVTADVGVDIVNVANLDTVGDLIGAVNVDGVDYNHFQQGLNNLYIQQGVTVLSSNAPIAQDDVFTGNEDGVITGNLLVDNGNGVDIDYSASGLSTIAATITTTQGGTVVVSANGDFTYTPLSDFDGTDSFTYTLENGVSEQDTGLVTLNVTSVNDGPTAQNDTFTATKNIDLTGDLLADNGNGEDTDIETVTLSATAETITTSNNATVVINSDGTFTYTPATGFIGPDSFNYTLVDTDGGTDVGSVSILVQGPNALPEGNIALINDGTPSTNISDSQAVNVASSYDAKTTIVRFDTDTDITSRQIIYKQGGGTRGINIFIENGELHMAVWNNAEENWGYKEISTPINAGQTYNAAFIFEGVLPSNGTISGTLDDVSIGSETGVGLLYGHSGDISVGQNDGSALFGGSNDSSANVFQGDIAGVVQYNEVLSQSEIIAVENNLATPNPIFVIEDVAQDTVPNDPSINNGGPYAEKTLSVAFTTGTDITSRQVIYEQGGTVRGMSIYIEGGQIHIAAWNYAEENWGYKEVVNTITADTFYTSTLLLDGVQNETGTLTGFVNGIEAGIANNVGLLYNHPGAIGIGELVNGAVFGGSADGGDHVYVFGGTIERIAQYNDALDGEYLLELHSTMASENPNVTDNTFIGNTNDNVIGGGNGADNIQGRDGNDSISGNGGDDTLRGENGNDVLNGGSGLDKLYGGAGNDTLIGGTGVDVLYGEAGDDIFGFLQMDGSIDQIRDFELSGGDQINITDILVNFEVGVSDILDFVTVNVVNAGRTDIRINHDGLGNDSEVLAIVRGSDFTGNTAQDLLDNGVLIVDQTII